MLKKMLVSGWIASISLFPAIAGEAEVRAAQQTVAAQIEAFRLGNAQDAYSYAAPNITRAFPDVDIFMKMVTRGYEPVHRSRSFAFGKSREIGSETIMQEVFLVGPDGRDHTAIYQLQLQDDGSWKISGVAMMKPKGQSI